MQIWKKYALNKNHERIKGKGVLNKINNLNQESNKEKFSLLSIKL